MPVKAIPSLHKMLYAFFHEWLTEQRNASHRTVLAYRDAWRLFLRFVAERQKTKVASLGLDDLNREDVTAFLQHIEKVRKASIVTRNCRLAALRSFFGFVAAQEPLAVLQCAEVLQVPFKKTPRRAIRYLDSAEVSAILSQPDRTRAEGQRDHALLSLLYNSGARIQEALDLRPKDLHLKSPAHVRLMGKGRKERAVPLTGPTQAVLREWLRERGGLADNPVFPTRTGRRLSRDAVERRVSTHAHRAEDKCASLRGKRVTAHVFRHTCAMSLLQAGVDISVIALWLGHADIRATNVYLHADMTIKERALALTTPANVRPGRYRPSDPLLAFLESL